MKTKLILMLGLVASIAMACKDSGDDDVLIDKLYKKRAQLNEYSNGEKTIRFVGMHHIGLKEFYAEVRQHIEKAKKEDYVLFYESIRLDNAPEVLKRKIQKMLGFVPSKDQYDAFLKTLNKPDLIVQDNKSFLGLINNKDFVADRTIEQIIADYEKKFGEIIITKKDLKNSLDEIVTPSLPKKKVMQILVDTRNEHLAQEVINSPNKKIIIMYGEGHEKGFVEVLKSLDARWEKK